MLDIVILAAGMGTRMKSHLPKVLHPVAGRPMILEVLATARCLAPNRCVIIVGHGAEAVQEVVGTDAAFALQAPQLGTGHAVMQAQNALRDSEADTVLVLFGDTPLLQYGTLQRVQAHHQAQGAVLTVISFLADDPTGYGRIVRDEAGVVQGIVEHKDATPAQREIRESNGGIMLFDSAWLRGNLARLTVSPQGEYYLTDMVAMAVADGRLVEGMIVDEQEVMGINNRLQLAEASQILWERRRRHWLLEGVTMIDPHSVWIDAEVMIGADTVIHPNVVLRGRTTIASHCEIGPHSVLEDAILGAGCRVTQSQIIGSTLAENVSVGPFALVRGGSRLEQGVSVGAGAEINRSTLGVGSLMRHFGYLGDTRLGGGVNVGAGSITCNFDGKETHPTVVGDGVFLGSDTLLIAPITVGAHARTGAGAVVTHDVMERDTVLGVPARSQGH